MMRLIELWLALTTTARDTLEPLLDDPDYNGPHAVAVRILRHMIQRSTVQRMFRTGTFGNPPKSWVLFSVHLDVSANPQRAKEAVDYLATNYPGNVQVLGAWWFDSGLPVGCSRDDQGEITGTPEYPTPTTALLRLMPQDVDWSDPDNPVYSEPTELKQVHKIQGQADRIYL